MLHGTRLRRRLAVPALALLTVGSAGCGSDGDSESTTGDRPVEHAMGTTEVPDDPQRVVVLDSPHLDTALSFGVTPVAAVDASEAEGMPAYLGERTAGIESVGTIESPNLEAVSAADPDLILSAKVRHEDLYDQLDAIAPTVFTESSGTDWKDGFTTVADALGRSDEGTDLLADYEARAEAVGRTIGAADMTASIVRFLPDEIRLYGPETFSGSVLADVGFDLGDHEWDEYSMSVISLEQIARADADVIFATTWGDAAAVRASAEDLWATLPAVQEDRQFDVDDDEWMLGIGLIGADIVLDDLETLLAPAP